VLDRHGLVERRGRASSLSGNCFISGPAALIKEVHDAIWLVSLMDYALGYFDLETRVLERLENSFGPKVLPMS
jgi:hypothetical protein